MSAEIVIRGGTVVDGSGAPGYAADVAIENGVITEIGPNLEGERELDASGCAVSSGFIDVHTHYDAQVFWDPALRPSSCQGVTTVVAGNCGFGIAPARPEHHEVLAKTLENVEAMDFGALVAGIPWEFETFPEYLDAVSRRGSLLNFTAYMQHSSVRLFVMGDDAYERHATAEEIQRMCEVVVEGIEYGAAGYSTSFAFTHRGMDGKPVPSRYTGADEVAALFEAAGSTHKGAVLSTPGEQAMYKDFYAWETKIGRPFIYPLFAPSDPAQMAEQLELHAESLTRGARVYPQVTPRPLSMQFTMADPFSLNVGKLFGDLLAGSREERLAAYRDPAWREKASADIPLNPMAPRWEATTVDESAKFPELVGKTIDELTRERGGTPLDVLLELSLAEDLETRFRVLISNDDPKQVGKVLAMENTVLGLSDAGAHVSQLCDAPLYTDLLAHYVRERGVLTLEQGVRKSTGEAADIFGFVRRGYLRPGYWADVCVFDPKTIGPGPLRRVRDFPAGSERLTAEEPTGVRHVLVNGTPIRLDEQQVPEAVDQRPGMRPEMAVN